MKDANIQFRVDGKSKSRWEKCAEKKTRGNLTLWAEIELNKAADKLLGKGNDDPNLLDKEPKPRT